MTISIPEVKLGEIMHELHSWEGKVRATRGEMQGFVCDFVFLHGTAFVGAVGDQEQLRCFSVAHPGGLIVLQGGLAPTHQMGDGPPGCRGAVLGAPVGCAG